MSRSEYKVGAYQASEGSYSIRGRRAVDGQDKAIIVVHGRTIVLPSGQTCLQFAQSSAGAPPHLQFLSEYGYGILSIDAGGGTTWGNDASITAVGNAITWVKGASGWADSTKKVALLGYSMGGCVLLNYATRNPSQIAGFVGEAPAVDLTALHNDATYTAEIDTAYGGNFAANSVGHDPLRDFASTFTVPSKLYVATDDPTVTPTAVQGFYNAMPSGTPKTVDVLSGGGHTNFWQYIDQQALLAWLAGLSW